MSNTQLFECGSSGHQVVPSWPWLQSLWKSGGLLHPNFNKNSTPSFHALPIKLVGYPVVALCPVKGLSVYVGRTAPIRKSRKLIMSYHNFTEVSTATVRSYVTTMLAEAGINSKVFTAHSTRHSSSSAKLLQGVPLKEILAAGGWKSDSSFRKHYNLKTQ